MTKATKQAQSAGRKLAALLAVAVSVGGGTFAGDVWDGNNLTIFGSRDPDVVYEKLMDGEAVSTCKDFLQVQIEGGRRISRIQKFYNLDAIISVGYRVNSIRGVKFRQWATRVLKEYLLRGLVRDRRIGKLEKRMTAAERSIDTIIYTLMPALPANRKPIGFNP